MNCVSNKSNYILNFDIMASYVITGGASFIGVALTELLISEGHNVWILCRNSSKNTSNIPQNDLVKIIYYNDLSEIKVVLKFIEYADVFIHLAWAGTSHDGRNDVEMQEDNIRYSIDAIHIAHQLKCKVFLVAGSQAEYGYVTDLITEDTPCNPVNEYGKAKLKLGEIAENLCAELNIKYIHLRIISIYGDTDHSWTLVMSSIRKMLSNEDVELSDCTQKWNFVYIKDAVKQMYLLVKHALANDNFRSEVFHIGSHDTRELKDFVMEMYKLTQSNSKLIFGAYSPACSVSLNPSVAKTKKATGGFISDYKFEDVIKKVITNYKSSLYEKNK